MRHRYTLTFDVEADTYQQMPTADQLRETLEGVIPDEWYQPDEYVEGGMADFRLLSIGAEQMFDELPLPTLADALDHIGHKLGWWDDVTTQYFGTWKGTETEPYYEIYDSESGDAAGDDTLECQDCDVSLDPATLPNWPERKP